MVFSLSFRLLGLPPTVTILASLLVLAAGVGSRYGSVKQIDRVGPYGETIIDYSVFDALRAGFSKVVFVIRRSIEADFREVITDRLADRIDVRFAYQELDDLPPGFSAAPDRVKPWGTGHAVLVAASHIDEPFAVVNADDFYGAESFAVLGDHLGRMSEVEGAPSAMVGFKLRQTLSRHGSVSRGVCEVNADGFLRSVTERTQIAQRPEGIAYHEEEDRWEPLSGDEIVSMNMFGLGPSVFEHLERDFVEFLTRSADAPRAEFYLPAAITHLMDHHDLSVRVLESPARWFGLTYRDDLPVVREEVARLIESGAYPAKLWG